MMWLLRLAVLLAVVLLLRRLWRWFWTVGWKRLFAYTVERAERPPASSRLEPRRGVMKRDPVCGTFVDVELAVRDTAAGGETLHFCSERCRDLHRERQRLPVEKTG